MDEMNRVWEVAKETVADVAEEVKEAAGDVVDAVEEAAEELKFRFFPDEEDCPVCKCKRWIDDTLYEINCLWNEHKKTILIISGVVAGVAAAATALWLLLKKKV